MKTNFFGHIAGLNAPGFWKISIHYGENGQFVVSALFAPTETNDPALKTIAPLIFKGTASEMDEGFFEVIEKPVQETTGLYSNLDAYRKSLEGAKKKLAQGSKGHPVKAKTDMEAGDDEGGEDVFETAEPKLSAEEKKRVYTEAINKVFGLNDACKYAEALAVLPSAGDYPEKAGELNKFKADLTRKKEQMAKAMELFNQD